MSRGRPRQWKLIEGTFGYHLCQLRESKKLSVTELARKAGIKSQYITQLEKGVRMPSSDVIQKLSTVLEVLPITLKLWARQMEFWDIYPVDLTKSPAGYSLSEINKDEEIKLLWFLKYVRTSRD